mmetsp:Transcript_14736/g.36747  ORF Transcript_14736/g.36747 Transcript_14736/m.36747 type:complete len:245 (-) Transcript_14736:613-1347(-)
MFARFRGLRNRLRQRAVKHHELTVDNSGLTRAQIDTGLKALKILGLDSQDALTKHDLVIFLYAVGLNPTDDVIDSKLRILKLHQNESVSFGQLCHIWHSMLQDLTDEEEILRRAFQFFDKDGNGEISVTELRTTMHELGDLLTEEEIMAFMQVMDVNNDGVIGYQEFLATLKTQSPEMLGADDAYFEQAPQEAEGAQGQGEERAAGDEDAGQKRSEPVAEGCASQNRAEGVELQPSHQAINAGS